MQLSWANRADVKARKANKVNVARAKAERMVSESPKDEVMVGRVVHDIRTTKDIHELL